MTQTRSKTQTAEVFLSVGQQVTLAVAALFALLYIWTFGFTGLLQLTAAAITLFYLVFVGAKLVVSFAGAGYRFPELTLPDVHDADLPTYSILVPMRGENAVGFDKLVKALARLHYPVDKLQVLFLIDEDDQETLAMVDGFTLPQHMEVVEVPDAGPRTKPRACDYGMNAVTGDMTVIFDFEDRPEPDALLKAVATMRYERFTNRNVACVQGMLQFWNPRGGLANVFYWAEYVVHFQWILLGMARLGLVPPLGGTSNHFLTSALYEVDRQYGTYAFPRRGTGEIVRMPNVWDAFNVTEDADLAARFKRCGFLIRMLHAFTFEEAPNTLRKARNQKSRWIKGYLQTWLVQSRRPIASMREMGVMQYFVYNLFIGGTPFSLIINPIVWLTTLLYVVSRLAGWEGVTLYIEGLFPAPVYYTAMFVAVFGNAILLYQQLVTVVRQQEHESFAHQPAGMQRQQFGLTPRLLIGLVPWWIFTTVPAYMGVLELLNPGKRYFWNKTPHSHAAGQEGEVFAVDASRQPAALPSSPQLGFDDRPTVEQQRVK